MKKITNILLSDLLKKNFFLIKTKKNFFLKDYYFILQNIKQFLRLKNLDVPIYIFTQNKQNILILKHYFLKKKFSQNIFIVDNYMLNIKDSIVIFLSTSKTDCRIKNDNLVFLVNCFDETNSYNNYKLFFNIQNLTEFIIFISLVRKVIKKFIYAKI